VEVSELCSSKSDPITLIVGLCCRGRVCCLRFRLQELERPSKFGKKLGPPPSTNPRSTHKEQKNKQDMNELLASVIRRFATNFNCFILTYECFQFMRGYTLFSAGHCKIYQQDNIGQTALIGLRIITALQNCS
jgi:hypothetical protein